MKDRIIKKKSFGFAVPVVKLYQLLCSGRKETVLSKQLLRSGTSIGANVREAINAESTADFIINRQLPRKNVTKRYIGWNY